MLITWVNGWDQQCEKLEYVVDYTILFKSKNIKHELHFWYPVYKYKKKQCITLSQEIIDL